MEYASISAIDIHGFSLGRYNHRTRCDVDLLQDKHHLVESQFNVPTVLSQRRLGLTEDFKSLLFLKLSR